MDGLLGNLFGVQQEDPLLAMLPPEQRARLQAQTRSQGITNLGLALLQAGGPTRTPGGFGQRLGEAGMQAMQANQGLMDRNLERVLGVQRLQQQQEELQRERQQRTLQEEAISRFAQTNPELANVLRAFPGAAPRVLENVYAEQKPRGQLITTEEATQLGLPANIRFQRLPDGKIEPVQGTLPEKQETPSSVREYQFAVSQGFKGTFQDFKALGAPKTQVNVNAPFETQYGKTLGGETAKIDLGLWQTAQKIPANIQKIDETINQLQTSQARTGFAAEFFKDVDRARAKILADEKAGKRVADTEVLDALLGSEVFPQIGALGIGARGLDTPAEREFLRKVIAGTITMDKAALVRLAEIRRNVEERAANAYNQALRGGELDDFFASSKKKKQEVVIPERPTIAQEPSKKSVGRAPAGVMQKTWEEMTDEQRALWRR